MHASHVAMELTRRRQDLEKQVDGRAGLTEDEMQVREGGRGCVAGRRLTLSYICV